MFTVIKIVTSQFISAFRSRTALHAKTPLLRHQITILRRRAPKRVNITQSDHAIFKIFLMFWPSSARLITIVHPKTLVRWHREGFRLYWRWKSQRIGRPKTSSEIRLLVRKMSTDNPLWGAPRFHGELLKLGFDVSQATVSRYMPKRPPNPDQTWRTFVRNHMDCTAAIGFLVVPTLTFSVLYILVVLHHGRRELVHFAITTNPTAQWTAQQITEAFPWNNSPRYIVRDNDGTYGETFRKRLGAMYIQDVRTAPRSTWQNAYAERVLGSIRRECLDHIIIKNEKHLRSILKAYLSYYNRSRTHLSLNKDPPISRPVEPATPGRIVKIPIVGGLHHWYKRVAA